MSLRMPSQVIDMTWSLLSASAPRIAGGQLQPVKNTGWSGDSEHYVIMEGRRSTADHIRALCTSGNQVQQRCRQACLHPNQSRQLCREEQGRRSADAGAAAAAEG